MRNHIEFLRYIITGGMTTALDFLVLYIAVEKFSTGEISGKFFAFTFAVMFSFLMNKNWTFKRRNTSGKFFEINQFTIFLFVSTVGLIFSLSLMYAFTHALDMNYLLANVLVSALILFWNFLANSIWSFPEISEKCEASLSPEISDSQKYEYELSVVIPSYNEEKRLGKTIQKARNFFSAQKISHEIIVVNDGSADKTSSIARENDADEVITFSQNQGKGAAVKAGVLAAKGRYILFCDADGATPFSEYLKLQKFLGNSHFVIGSRYKSSEFVGDKQPLYRVFSSGLVNVFIQIFLLEGISDTQCGFKLMHSKSGKKVFEMQKIPRFAFDIEMLILAQKYGYCVQEISVEWHDQEGSTFHPVSDGLRTLWEILKIQLWKFSGKY